MSPLRANGGVALPLPTVYIPTVFFGGAALAAGPGQLLGEQQEFLALQFFRRGGYGQEVGNQRGSHAGGGQVQHPKGFAVPVVPDFKRFSGLKNLGGLQNGIALADAACFERFCRQCPGFEQSDRPQVLIRAHGASKGTQETG